MRDPKRAKMSNTDARSPISICPASQDEVFIVPARYAMAEYKAQHGCFSPAAETQSHPMALRRLRTGYLYLWHDQGPLKRYAVATDGRLQPQGLDDPHSEVASAGLAGIALDKAHDAWLLYTEMPMGVASYQQLEDPQQRTSRMRKIALTEVARRLEATHCPPLEKADELVAELMPEVRNQALAADQQKNGETYQQGIDQLSQRMMENPTFDNTKAYTEAMLWQRERQTAAANHPDASENSPGAWSVVPWQVEQTGAWVEQAQGQAGALWPVFAAVDDDLGVLRDLNFEQEQLEVDHTKWVADNNIRLTVGGFVRSLISEDGGEVANMLNYRYLEHDIQMTPEQGKIMLDSQSKLDQLLQEETRINQGRGQAYSHESADALLKKIHVDIESALAPVRQFIPAQLSNQTQVVVREYRQSKVSNLAGGKASARVAEYIDLERMNTWLEQTAPTHYQHVETRHNALYADRGQYLQRNSNGTWFVDYDNVEHLDWLDALAEACLSGQCIRKQGAEQFNDYVRAPDDGAFRLLFMAWSPSLEGAINSQTRMGEIVAALSSDNLGSTRSLLAKTLDDSALRALDRIANNIEGTWSTTVTSLGASLLALKSQTAISKYWLATLISVRLGNDAWLASNLVNGSTMWQLLGTKARALNEWSIATAKAIGLGHIQNITQSAAVKNSGGLLPIAALLLNGMNAENYLSQATSLETMDEQRMADTVSASLYAAAALTAVVDNWLRVGKGVKELKIRTSIAPTLTLFGGVVGGLSAIAAFKEFTSLEVTIENSQSKIDPWLDTRKSIVLGQVAIFGAQAVLGLGLTIVRLAGVIDTATAIARYRLGMGPINLLLLGLGLGYLYAWWKQSTPMQNFLASCCWSRSHAYKSETLAPKAQVAELEQLLRLLYTPRVSIETSGNLLGSVNYISQLSIDLPGAASDTTRLAFALVGNPSSMQAIREGSLFEGGRMFDIGATWLASSECTWIPADQGQGLRLTGAFITNRVFASQPTKVALRLGYHSPVATLAGVEPIIGGHQGLAFTLTSDGDIVETRPTELPVALAQATIHPLGNGQCSIYLQPKGQP